MSQKPADKLQKGDVFWMAKFGNQYKVKGVHCRDGRVEVIAVWKTAKAWSRSDKYMYFKADSMINIGCQLAAQAEAIAAKAAAEAKRKLEDDIF
jgi:hypothetical protein